MKNTIQDRIIALRAALRLTLQQFADKAGVSLAAVFDWEHGRSAPKETFRRQICAVFNVNREWLDSGRGAMFAPGKSADQLELETFSRVVARLFRSLPPDQKTVALAAARAIFAENALFAVGDDDGGEDENGAPAPPKRKRGRPRKIQ